jgi:RHS repeat-associated protein
MTRATRIVLTIAIVAVFSTALTAQVNVPYVKPENDTGVNPFGTYAGTRESINLSNGNLHIEIPLLALKGRNGQNIVITAQYDSKLWSLSWEYEPLCNTDNYLWQTERREPTLGLGWRLNIPYMFGGEPRYDDSGNNFLGMAPYIFTSFDGAKHSISPTQGLGVADSFEPSPVRLEKSLDGVVITTAEGTKYYFSYVHWESPDWVDSTPTKIVDASGNVITISNGVITDNVGHQVSFSAETGIHYKDSEGNDQNITFGGAASFSLNPTFSGPTPYGRVCRSGYAVTVRTILPYAGTLGTITFPGGYTYTFDYNSFGEMRHIYYPTGGYTEYDYLAKLYAQSANAVGDFREVAWKSACTTTGTAPGCTKTTYEPDSVGGTSNNMVTITENSDASLPDQKIISREYFTQADIGGAVDALPALEIKKEALASDGVTVLRRTSTSYTSLLPKLPSSVVTMIDDTTPTETDNPTSTENFQYDNYTATICTTSYTVCSQRTMNLANVTQREKYDYTSPAGSGGLLQRTISTYKSSYYLTPHIMTLKTREQVYDSSGLRSDTKYNHDEANYLSQNFTNPAQHDSAYGTGYTTRGLITSVERWRDAPTSGWPKTQYWYDTLGNLLKVRDPGNHETQFEYTDQWEQTTCSPQIDSRAYVTKITDANLLFVQGKYDSCTGALGRLIDKNGQQTTFLYDPLGRLTQTKALANNAQTDLGYTATTLTTTKTITSSINQVSVQTADGLGRVYQSCSSDPDGDVCAETTYDFRNRKTAETNPHRSAGSATDGTTRYYFDVFNRTTRLAPPDAVLDANGNPQSNYVLTEYVGNKTTVTDQAGKQRRSWTDALGRLKQVDEPGGTPGSRSLSTPYTTLYQYNGLGLLLQVDQKGGDSNSANWRTRTASYDTLGQLLSAYNPESGSTDYAYNDDGQVISRSQPQPNQTNRSTKTTTYYCYLNDRLTGKKYSSNPCTSPDVGYTYDAGTYGKDRRTGMTDSSGSTTWVFDAVGNVSSVSKTIGTVTKTFGYTYNLDNSVGTLTYPSGTVLTYRPTTAGRVDKVSDTGTAYADEVHYWPVGALHTAKYGVTQNFTGLTQDDTYSPRLQPTILSVASPSQTLLSLNYTFSQGTLQAPINNGNLMSITNNLDSNWSRAFTYDELNRVLSAQTPTSANYGAIFTVDPWGNLTNKTQITGKNVVWPISHAVSNLNQFTDMDYDAAGNVVNDRIGHSYTYDPENRICKLAQGTSCASPDYVYDGDGQRVKKSSGMLYFTGTGLAPLLETDLSGNATAEYVFFNGKRVTRIDRPTGTPHYYVTDHLGSTAKVTNANGSTIEETNELGAFGEPILGGTGRYVFTGKERDIGGEDYFGARYYAFRAGRFLTPDWSATPQVVPYAQLGSPQSLNLYGYVQNNPVTGIDPDGHMTREMDGNMMLHASPGGMSFEMGTEEWSFGWDEKPGTQQKSATQNPQQLNNEALAGHASSAQGSQHWAVANRTTIAAGRDKCNEFIGDMAESVGRVRPRVRYTGWRGWLGFTRDPSAKEWATMDIPGYSKPMPVSSASKGDIIAVGHPNDPHGHVGIYVGNSSVASANWYQGGAITVNNWGFRPSGLNDEQGGTVVVRKWLGEQ